MDDGVDCGRPLGFPLRLSLGLLVSLAISIPWAGLNWAAAIAFALGSSALAAGSTARQLGLKPRLALGVAGAEISCRDPKGWREATTLAAAGIGGPALLALVAEFGVAERLDPSIPGFMESLTRHAWLWAAFQALPLPTTAGGWLCRPVLRRISPARSEALAEWLGVGWGAAAAAYFLGIEGHYWYGISGIILAYRSLQQLDANPRLRRSHRYAARLLREAQSAFDGGDFREAQRLCHLLRAEPDAPENLVRPAWLLIARADLRLGDLSGCEQDLKYAGDGPEVDAVRDACRRAQEAARQQVLPSPAIESPPAHDT